MNTKLIKERRKELGLTMLDVAKACGVSEATVSRWESADIADPSVSKVVALTKILKLDISDLIDYKYQDEFNEFQESYVKKNYCYASFQDKRKAYDIMLYFFNNKLMGPNDYPVWNLEEYKAIQIILSTYSEKLSTHFSRNSTVLFSKEQKIPIQEFNKNEKMVIADSLNISVLNKKGQRIAKYIDYTLIQEFGNMYCIPSYKLKNNEKFQISYMFFQ